MQSCFDEVKKNFGFGCMRLPMKGKEVDFEETAKMVDMFLANGFNYFDTAHGYLDGQSEIALKKCLTSRYPREAYILTNKLSGHYIEKNEDIRPFFQKQLEACGVDYFDFYLMHAQNKDLFAKYKQMHAYETVMELRDEGKIRHFGISFHDKAEVLDQILTEYPQIEVVQIQFNYVDYEDTSVESRKCYEVCCKHGKPVIVMEPVKGGLLANPPETVAQVLKAAAPEKDLPSWALRFAASLEGIITVLSGMSTLEQMEQNLATMKEFSPLSAQEQAVVAQAREALASLPSIPCTSCQYCVKGCPQGIPIPGVFSAMNTHLIYGNTERAKGNYGFATRGKGKASDCIQCGQCESVCPQHISIIRQLQQAAEVLE